MNISIKATGHELTDEMRTLVEEKFSAIARRVSGSISPAALSCEIEQSLAVERAGAKYRAEGLLSIDGESLYAEARSATLEGAVDAVRDDLLRKVKNMRGKKRELLRRGGAALKRILRFGR